MPRVEDAWRTRNGNADTFREELKVGLERFHQRHLLRRGTYFRLRAFLPLPVLALVWFLEYRHGNSSIGNLFDATITLEHLFEAVAAATMWAIGVSRIPNQTSMTLSAFRHEVGSLLRVSLGCGLLLLVWLGVRGYWESGVRVGLTVFAAFAVSSIGLLCLTVSSSAGWLPEPGQARTALIIGSGPRASMIAKIAQRSYGDLSILGFLDDVLMKDSDLPQSLYLGGLDLLPAVLKEHPVDLVLIGLPVKSMYETIQRVVSECELVGVESHFPLDIFTTRRTTVQPSDRLPRVAAHDHAAFDVRLWCKRGLDFTIAAVALILLSPLLLIISIAVWATSKGPVYFVQERYGLNRQRFPMYKFRSMVVDAERRQAQLESQNEVSGPVFKLKKDPRVTQVGAFLRRTSLDELPQLFNVLRGEMAIVGPRPLPLRDVSKFDESWLLRRFSVRPGLTCLWQVKGRSNTMFDEWMQLDLEYIDNWSLGGDIKIMLLTIPAVLRGSGAM